MTDRALAREAFILRIAVALAEEDNKEAHRLDDLFVLRGNKPTLFMRNDDDATDADIKIHESVDGSTWTLNASTVTIPKKGRTKLDFTSDAKYIRFTLDADVVGGVHCELAHFNFNPSHQAEV